MSASPYVVGATGLARMFKRSRWWAHNLFREWWSEQEKGGPVRVFRRKSGYFYTTIAIVDQYLPRRRDEVLERRLKTLERDLSEIYGRVAELERRIGKRR